MKNLLITLVFLLPIITMAQSKEELLEKIASNPKDVGSIALIQKVGGYDPDYKELGGLFKTLDKKVRKTTQGQIFDRYLKALESSSVGKKAPSITQFDLEGSPYGLSDLRGQYVLIDFWASWCPPCREENPKLVALYEEFQGKNFEILGISFDQEFENWQKAVQDDKLTWKHISDLQGWKSAPVKLYEVRGIPQNFLIDPSGKIVASNLRGEALDAKLAELLK